MAGSGLSFLKTFIKSSLDNYVLPGTFTGTEILLVYISHWKRNAHAFYVAALRLLIAELDWSKTDEIPVSGEVLSDGPGDANNLAEPR